MARLKPKPDKPEDPVTPGFVMGSYGVPSIDQWDKDFIAGCDAVKAKKGVVVNPRFLKAMMDVEADHRKGNMPPDACRPCDGEDCVPACGPMQIKWPYHVKRCPECNKNTVPGQIEMAAHIIGDTMKAHGLDEYGAFLKAYFTADDINGTTQKAYVARIKRSTSPPWSRMPGKRSRSQHPGPTSTPGDPTPTPHGQCPCCQARRAGRV